MEGKLFINYGGEGGGGFSEVYKMNTTVYSTANANLLEIINNRAACLAYNFSIAHATNSRKMRKGDSSLPVGWNGTPILLDVEAALDADAPCNDREVALVFKFDTGVGKQANRLLRAIRDQWVIDGESQVVYSVQSSPFAYTATVATDGYGTAVENYVNVVALHTSHFVPGMFAFSPPSPTLTAGWDPLAWAAVYYHRVGDRDMGRGYSARKARRKARI